MLTYTRPETPSEEQKAVHLENVPEIPRKPKAPTPASEQTNGTSGLNKRKREAEEPLTNGDDRVKRVASVSVAEGDNSEPIVLDEVDGGAILIDDD